MAYVVCVENMDASERKRFDRELNADPTQPARPQSTGTDAVMAAMRAARR